MPHTKVQNPLDRLYRLQELVLEVRTKTELRSRTPDDLTHVEASFQEALKKRKEGAERLAAAAARKKVLDEEVVDLDEKLAKFQQQLQAVKTTREYSAVLNEIETVKREKRGREDELLSIEESVATARADSESQDAAFPGEEASYGEKMADWRAEQERLGREISRAEAEAEEIRKGVDKRTLAQFDRIAKMRAGVAVARVTLVGAQTAACSACNVRLRPQLLSDLRLSRETIYCESCRRMLYWEGPSRG